MKKRTKLIIGAGLAAGVLYASKTENRQFVIGQVADTINKWTDDDYIINLGKPENVRDANMVDEGAMTSVQFYYDLRDKANKVS
ncbi:hypothetical protein JEOAER750_00510 [Jeotgalicoccus aerolatus]|uniref:Uncharacterized protein n=1 Tax=Jeotgalicoccus aerolatus TaxID=709510 RepID=A0A1G8XN40_9STAP|nr:hypothetical protein [Jeotgalicoccus aerolatus]MBP1952252.1 hypothetical protein [Jeotgalicoccus aerolatus]GGE02814.1 hypothetical protein GCM10007273_14210 [Jeotgalicoccus aerolatus]CAD2072955.1 hypothetical protein JEOAER750_00510 [Jeotgalicoccus aerolatus]SDJ92019.1 hypothetical protein SAMN05216187_103223 [Jeotgalicoccus aerolatus]